MHLLRLYVILHLPQKSQVQVFISSSLCCASRSSTDDSTGERSSTFGYTRVILYKPDIWRQRSKNISQTNSVRKRNQKTPKCTWAIVFFPFCLRHWRGSSTNSQTPRSSQLSARSLWTIDVLNHQRCCFLLIIVYKNVVAFLDSDHCVAIVWK